MDAAVSGPLAGILVCDLTRVLSGPYCTQMLSDLGARVIKVERPGTGDDTRAWGPPWVGGTAAYFMSANRNKESIAVDLKHPDGLAVVRRLAARADVLVENFRPGTADELGLGYETLRRENPRLIYASISGFGQTGPYRERPGYDAIAQGMGGMMAITGEPDGPPVRAGVAIADIGAGMWAAFGIVAALYHRERSGRGQYVDCALLDGQVAWMTYAAANYFATGETPRRYGSAHPSIVPYQAVAVADGYIMLAVGNDAIWRRFCAALGEPELAEHPSYRTNPDRVAHREDLLAYLDPRLRRRTMAEWLEAFERAGVPAGPIYTMPQVFADPQVQAREMVVELPHPTAGTVRVTGNPVKLSETPGAVRTAPPLLGQHTDAVLAFLGYDAEAIAALRAAGAVA
jgi:crotonobetainyl-CoA:carnitine CoA-transferase CaiB-like acyl-CoA transferase